MEGREEEVQKEKSSKPKVKRYRFSIHSLEVPLEPFFQNVGGN